MLDSPAMGLRDLAIRLLPAGMVAGIRRRRATKRFIRAVSLELADRGAALDDLEERLAARRGSFHEGVAREVLERTDLVLQELDRKVEGVEARHAGRLRGLEEEITALRRAVEELRTALHRTPAE